MRSRRRRWDEPRITPRAQLQGVMFRSPGLGYIAAYKKTWWVGGRSFLLPFERVEHVLDYWNIHQGGRRARTQTFSIVENRLVRNYGTHSNQAELLRSLMERERPEVVPFQNRHGSLVVTFDESKKKKPVGRFAIEEVEGADRRFWVPMKTLEVITSVISHRAGPSSDKVSYTWEGYPVDGQPHSIAVRYDGSLLALLAASSEKIEHE